MQYDADCEVREVGCDSNCLQLEASKQCRSQALQQAQLVLTLDCGMKLSVPRPGSHSDEYVLSLALLVHAVPHLTTMHSPLPLLLLLLAAAAAASLVVSLRAMLRYNNGDIEDASGWSVSTSNVTPSACLQMFEWRLAMHAVSVCT
jgi:hypothetical protein